MTGPISPDHGYPEWYQDENGARVAICDDQDDPLCGLPDVADGTYDPALPISFPGNFPEELFWWSADATFDTVVADCLAALEAHRRPTDGHRTIAAVSARQARAELDDIMADSVLTWLRWLAGRPRGRDAAA